MISFSIEGSPYTTKSHESVLVYDYAKANYEGLCDFFLDSDLCLSLHSDSVEQVWSFLKETIVKGLNVFVPKVKIFPKDHPTWFNSEIRHAIKCLRSLRHKCIKHPTPNNHSKIHSLETRLKELMISAKSHFEKQLVTQPPSKVFKYIRGLSSASSIRSSVSLDSSTASNVQLFLTSVYT